MQGTRFLLLGNRPNVYWGIVPTGYDFSIAMTARPIDLYVRTMVRLPDGRIALSPEWNINLSQNKVINWPTVGQLVD
jgi:hypothetical protein